MPVVTLSNRSIVDVAGPEAEHFLQNLVTADLDTLGAGQAKPSALLTPQGKILFDFLVARNGADAFTLECREDIADDLVKRLTFYKLRAKVQISKRDQSVVSIAWGDDSAASQTDSGTSRPESGSSRPESGGLQDLRFPTEPVVRTYAAEKADATEADWHAFRIASAVTESGADYALSDAFPHDVLLDQNGGVGFAKGCYIGQEVVSRMHHRGTARRRVLIARAEADLPPTGTEILVSGRPVGALATVGGRDGLAIVRIDRVKDALDAGETISAGGVALQLSIPAWAKFTFPETASGAESA